jgi:hypothetical protein
VICRWVSCSVYILSTLIEMTGATEALEYALFKSIMVNAVSVSSNDDSSEQ